ncbi:hypothetical protein HYFRA_00014061 [Hymenoscyphus fraxineus]|uniref:Uncharacterized protein n=1 Tax=Hymenoscyphus fraxineus TaxID=746836 RepID=A0A9N9LDQ7_9HELO|nr:hypothetical protein HYFRA_00014061 [Hymenoscyphus fraxineus]
MRSPSHPKPRLGNSWVVDDYDDDYSLTDENEDARSATLRPSPKRRTRTSNKGTMSPEPELVMPSLDIDSLDGSWAESTSTSRHRSNHRPRETTRRSPRTYTDSPDNRNTRKLATNNQQSAFSHPLSSSENTDTPPNIIELSIQNFLGMSSWFLDVLWGALRILKTPISYLLAIWFLFGAMIMMRNLVTTSIQASLSPICRIPGVTLLNLPFCPVYQGGPNSGPPPPVEFQQLITVQSDFEKVLEQSAGGASLPLDMKRGESSIRDLRQLVRYSSLMSKDSLVLEFDSFIETARIASYDLQRFNSHIGRAVDNVIATTRWTRRVLDGIDQESAGRGSISAFVNDNFIAPFQPPKFTEQILLDQYIKHTRSVEDEIFKLIEEAQTLLMILNNLEDRLEVIHGIATQEDGHLQIAKEETLGTLWAMVGGHKTKLNKMDRQLGLLSSVTNYRKKAHAHVAGTVLRLQAMGAGLEDLRERVGSPELLRDRAEIPLSVHIENIQRGVERLEEQRLNGRRIENDHIRETLERVQSPGSSEGVLIDG